MSTRNLGRGWPTTATRKKSSPYTHGGSCISMYVGIGTNEPCRNYNEIFFYYSWHLFSNLTTVLFIHTQPGTSTASSSKWCTSSIKPHGIRFCEFSKGQLISKCLLGDIVSTKKLTKNFDNFCPGN